VIVNGRDALRFSDESIKSGRSAFATITWGERATVRFDNMLVTSNGHRRYAA